MGDWHRPHGDTGNSRGGAPVPTAAVSRSVYSGTGRRVADSLRWQRQSRQHQRWADNGCLLHELIGVADRNCQVRAAKIIQNGEVHTNDLAIAIEERSAGTTGGCRRVVNNLVL